MKNSALLEAKPRAAIPALRTLGEKAQEKILVGLCGVTH
jgi:hypothetical protein